MKKQVHIENVGNVALTDKNYIGAGGEASVYQSGKLAVKIYHDSVKAIPKDKMLELGKIQAVNVLKPLHVVYDLKNKDVIGYAMQYIKNTEALCKLFTKSFKQQHNLTPQIIMGLIQKMQETVAQVHYDDCLIVDLNEMNLLTSNDFKIPYFIDTDSYQTPNYKATAIMDSIRDRTTSHGSFSNLTDWYAFAIIAFQLYIGIHPYKGKHPNYKPNQWQQRMDDGISVFDKAVSLPPVCNDFSVIPHRHRTWMEDLFLHNNRSEPPQISVSAPIAFVPKIVIINSSDTVNVDLVVDLDSKKYGIQSVYSFMGTKYYLTNDSIYKNNKLVVTRGFRSYDKILLCETNAMTPVICKLIHKTLTFESGRDEIGKLQTDGMMYKHGKIYTMSGGNLYRNSFREINNKTLHQIDFISQVSEHSSRMFEGFVYQDLLGKPYFTIPLDDKCKNYYIKELEGHRILDAKVERNVCVVMAERKGKYHRFVIIFDYDKDTYNVRKTEDVSYDTVNFTVIQKGVCILAIENKQAELFIDNVKIKVIDNTPFDTSTKLISFDNGVYFIHDDKLFAITMK